MFLRYDNLRNLLHSCYLPLDTCQVSNALLKIWYEVNAINVQHITNAVVSEDSTFGELGSLEIW